MLIFLPAFIGGTFFFILFIWLAIFKKGRACAAHIQEMFKDELPPKDTRSCSDCFYAPVCKQVAGGHMPKKVCAYYDTDFDKSKKEQV
jgi:hypothetical protein